MSKSGLEDGKGSYMPLKQVSGGMQSPVVYPSARTPVPLSDYPTVNSTSKSGLESGAFNPVDVTTQKTIPGPPKDSGLEQGKFTK